MDNSGKDRAPRESIKSSIEFIIDDDIIRARSVNISSTGISFQTKRPLSILMRINNSDGTTDEQRANLVWVKRNEEGGSSYGLQFEDAPEESA